MNNRFLTIASLLASSALFMAGCSDDNSAFETPNLNPDITTNPGTVSQNNFTILSSNLNPEIFADPSSNSFTFTELTITARIGDRNNQLLSDEHVIHFKTEWGLIQENCVTVDGLCTVTWQTSSADSAPADHKNTILAYTVGEESFTDTNGNGIFDDNDGTFEDLEEPYVDSNRDLVYSTGEPIVDVLNGNSQTVVNEVHDIGDTFFNGAGCTHSSLCSAFKSIQVWDDVQIDMNAPPPATP
jgi:hypothetical protein